MFRLVTTSKWPLLILRSLGQRSRSQWSSHVCHTCFRSITEERLSVGTLYLVCRLVMTSRWPLLILMSEGQRSGSWWPYEVKNGFRSITEECLGRGTPYLVCRLAMPSRRPLLILRSKSRSQWPWVERWQWQWAEKLFLLNNCRMLWPWKLIHGVQVGLHHQHMIPIGFEVTMLKVKVMVTFSWKMVSAQ